MRILFAGEVQGNNGPSNVNRAFIENWPSCDELVVLRATTKLGRLFEGLRKGLQCDVVLFLGSGAVEVTLHAILGTLKKPIVCFNHGYVPYENEVNDLGYSRRRISAIGWHMRTADAIVANSEHQMQFVRERLDGFSGRYDFVNLGVDSFEQASTERNNERPIIAVSGGTRPIKGNEIVVRAARILRLRDIDCELRVYGRDYAKNGELTSAFESGEATFMGQVPHEEFVRQLSEADVFVMNSLHESFGLSALDAIQAGCSLLLSRNCGVAGVLTLEKDDVVENYEDASEVADKIEKLLARPNADRRYQALDFDVLSWKRSAQKLRDVIVSCCSDPLRNNEDRGSL